MYISRVVIRNFRNFRLFDGALGPGVTCVIGENNAGKTNLLHAIRLPIDASLSSYRRQLLLDDFASGLDLTQPQHVLVSLEFKNFKDSPNQEAALTDCLIDEDTARITYRFRPRPSIRETLLNHDEDE